MIKQVVRADVDIISADPFAYYEMKDIRNTTEDSFWEKSLRNFHVCTSKNQGVKTLSITKTGCLKTVDPNKPSQTHVPILMKDCLPSFKFANRNAYGPWTCGLVQAGDFDATGVQLKVDGEQLHEHCRYHYLQIDQEKQRPCPDRVTTVTAKPNVTI